MKKYSNAAVNPCLRSLFNPYNQGKVSSTNTAMMKYPAMMKIVHILKKTSRILLTTDNYLKMTFQNSLYLRLNILNIMFGSITMADLTYFFSDSSGKFSMY